MQLWEAPQERVAWSDEAWKRLQTSPDFVRSGIRKAAERRARKLGLKEVDSEHLTTFRNQGHDEGCSAFGRSAITNSRSMPSTPPSKNQAIAGERSGGEAPSGNPVTLQ